MENVLENVKVEVDVVKPATPSRDDHRVAKMVYFGIANLVSFIIAGGIFAYLMFGIPEGQGFDHTMDHVRHFLRSHMAVTALTAAMPFFASLLVGQYEMRRGRARRKRQAAVELRGQAQRELDAQRAAREARFALKH